MKQTYKKLHIKSRKYNKTVKNKEKKQLYYSEVDHHKIKASILGIEPKTFALQVQRSTTEL